MKNLIMDILDEEWEQFQLVNSEFDRSPCQEDREQFNIMRMSQFMAWPSDLLSSYYRDLISAKFYGQNLIFNKYAYMTQATDPERYEQLKVLLPSITFQREQVIANVVNIHLRWAKEFSDKFPKFAGRGRPIYNSEALPGQTSIEAYQRGEILSYGDKTQFLYCNFVFSMDSEGKNLTFIIRDTMAKLYGYESVVSAEKSLNA